MNTVNVFDRNLKGLYCMRPFQNIELHQDEVAYACCPSWTTKGLGNFKKSKLSEVWNSEDAKEIRESILDGSYKYCIKNICPWIQGNTLNHYEELTDKLKAIVDSKQVILDTMPENVMFTHEPSCNLSCPVVDQKKSATQLILMNTKIFYTQLKE